MNVPFLDLKLQYLSIKDNIHAALDEVLEKTAFAGGPFVAQFEKEFAAFCGTKHAIAVGSGTEALWTTLVAAGVGPGDEVITVPDTFIATAEAISFCGATPVFVDIEDFTYNMDPARLEAAITPRTKAVIPVHLFGQTADMDPIISIARRYGLFIVEDACQAHGATYKKRNAGSIGDAGCFSFYPGKNLGAYGEAGAVVTSDDGIADRIRMFRDHGQEKKYHHNMVGWNARMDGFQAAVLSVKLKHIDSWNASRHKNAAMYGKLLSGAVDGLTLPVEANYGEHVYHIYAVRLKERDTLMTGLGEKGIATGIHYPVSLHLTGAYRFLGYKRGDFPVAERCAGEFVSLPMFPELSEEQICYVVDTIKQLKKS